MKFKYLFLAAAALLAFSSCDDYLDKLPDDRAELTTEEKITQLLVSAYPTCNISLIGETSSDNMGDNGRAYSSDIMIDELYRFKDVDVTGNDSPYYIWNGYYRAVAVANQALDAIAKFKRPEALKAQAAEAKLCRAYGMFMLANVFCMAWNPQEADKYPGLPYPLVPGVSENKRGTLRQLYEAINKDIEEALPNVNDAIYKKPKYHWNTRAAYAFAARFNLYYMNYDKAVEYADKALGANPEIFLRNYANYEKLGAVEINNLYNRASEPANFLLVPTYSSASRYVFRERFGHNGTIAGYETYWALAPWGQGSEDALLYWSNMLYGPQSGAIFPKMYEFFEYTDKVAGIGYVHVMDQAFTADETLLVRAEAYALKNNIDKALDDMNKWIVSHCREKAGTNGEKVRPVLTTALVDTFYKHVEYAPVTPDGNRDRSIRKILNPQGFELTPGTDTQENVLQLILHMRRLEVRQQGYRFYDVKRYGISYTHFVAGEDPIIFKPGDLRGAIQIPSDVVNAGLAKNPR
ncbi:RagB/SusD family nutrient uptake outer membrane protein [Prevotella sp. OH937_COT-195]|uniref:RagB/SusD family nutrient uptake outer membrane protein n=1 Tax=Prevotella sp. OH937_COT-195 TaxID=2491051 RepID=UPI000F655AEB|nr:RagB/SusD family nutrient uptake outer membrane protein [Prevotella sp. OH937_COT-195]RRD01923.1 RagB/SusD family nutrient uptake outer membrane protein [Prevotella sp. OH937_COT-195]